MIKQKKEIKRISLVVIFVALIFLSNISTINYLKPTIGKRGSEIPSEKENEDDVAFPLTNSELNFTDYISGKGVNQSVRVYMINESFSIDNRGYFNITSPAKNMYLSLGDFNFTFQNNFTADHIIEDDCALALSADRLISFPFIKGGSNLSINQGTNLTIGGFNNLTDGQDTLSWYILNSSDTGVLNFTIRANFTGSSYSDAFVDMDFDPQIILGMFLDFTYNLSKNANLTVKLKDFTDPFNPTWRTILNMESINSSIGPYHYIDETIINKNKNSFSPTNCSYIQFILNRTDNEIFNATLYKFDMKSSYGFEVPITNTSYPALEFDLRGENSTVNGFSAWIRTFNNPPIYYENFEFNKDLSYSNITLNEGKNVTVGGFNNLTDGKSIGSYFIINASSNGIVNFTIHANFSDIPPGVYTSFARDKIINLILSLSYNLTSNANLTIKILEGPTWKTFIDSIEINSGISFHEINKIFNNFDNGDYISLTNTCYFQFIFNRTDQTEYNVSLFDFNMNSTQLHELPFINTELNISLYRANSTIIRDGGATEQNSLKADSLEPVGKPIDSIIIDNNKYNDDKLTHFSFDSAKTFNLSLFNYFIIIKSNVSDIAYSLVTIPEANYGDDWVDHQLKITNDEGSNWENSMINLGAGFTQLDASCFKVNVTRGYLPSDFYINSTNNLAIQNLTIVDVKIEGYQYSGVLNAPYEWGKGRWYNSFPIAIANDSNLKFKVEMLWDASITNDFSFDVIYWLKSYQKRNATSTFNVSYDGIPQWTLNYTLNLKAQKFKGLNSWNFTELWFIYPDFYNAHNLTTPNGTQVFNQTNGEEIFSERLNYKKVSATIDFIDVDDLDEYNGSYLLNLTGVNSIYKMHSYINYNGILWETRGFMFGDNISVSVDIQHENGPALCSKIPNITYANVSLFYPNGTILSNGKLYSDNDTLSDDESYIYYDFGNHTILNLTESIPTFGKYILGYFWTNGSILGCKKMEIFINEYNLDIKNCTYNRKDGLNLFKGTTKVVKGIANYSLLLATVNETTNNDTRGFYPVNLTISDMSGYFSYNYLEEVLEVFMTNFMQNETILNPSEVINIKAEIQNLNTIFDLAIKIKVQFVSLANEEWIITETTSPTKVLKLKGDPAGNDKYQFNINLTMPDLQVDKIWKGVNAPVRKAGAKTKVTVYIEGNEAERGGPYEGPYESPEYSLLINKKDDEFEGHIIALKHNIETTRAAILQGFERDECLYLPHNTTFILNVYDPYFISSYDEYINSFSFKYDSEFENVTINPEIPLEGKSFNITSILQTEFGDLLPNKNVTCQYNNSGVWEDLGIEKTDDNGTTLFEIDTVAFNFDETIQFKLLWSGDNLVLNNSYEFEVSMIIQTNNFLISLIREEYYIYRNTNITLLFQLKNTGDSDLRIIDINITIDGDLDYSIIGLNYIQYDYFKSGDIMEILLEVEIPNVNFDLFNITIEISAQNLISNEIITIEKKYTLNVLDRPLLDYFMDYLIFIMIGIIASLFLIALIYAKKIKSKIEEIPAKPEQRRPRKGRYVKVSELKTEAKKIEKAPGKGRKGEPPAAPIKKKTATDLDSLLKEKGLDKKRR